MMTIHEMIVGYLNAHTAVKHLSKSEQLMLSSIFVSVVQCSPPQDHLQRVGELMAYCTLALTDNQMAEKKLARIANKALEIMLKEEKG